MSSFPAASPPRRAEMVVPEYLRNLVASARMSQSLAIETSRDATDTVAEASTTGQRGNWNARLAQLLHSMYLVSLIEKAQLGAMHYGGGGISVASEKGLTGTMEGISPVYERPPLGHAPPTHCVTIDDRWLDAVTRHSHLTCTIDDVARVAMAFPELVHVRWTLPTSQRSVPPLANGYDEAGSGPTGPLSLPHSHDAVSPVRSQRDPSIGKLRGRLYLNTSHVISVEAAEVHLQQALERKGTAAAQRAWLELVSHHTAYAAYVESAADTSTLFAGGSGAGNVAQGTKSCNGAANADAHFLDIGTGESTACEVRDENLLQQLSTELRSSLSAPMLRALLSQMRRDAAHTGKREQQRTAEQQLNERVMSAYEQVRALLGGKQASCRNALSLLVSMREESRFDDALDVAALLSRLLCIPASGLTATILREGEVRPDSQSFTGKGKTRNSKSKTGRGKRKRETEEVDAALLVHVTQTALERVTDLQSLSEEELRLVRVQLDRTKGSVKGVMEAVAQQHA